MVSLFVCLEASVRASYERIYASFRHFRFFKKTVSYACFIVSAFLMSSKAEDSLQLRRHPKDFLVN
jgi:hypothetical protein